MSTDPVEGDYLEPTAAAEPAPQHAKGGRAKGIGAAIAAGAALLFKFKALWVAILNAKYIFLFGKLFTIGWTFVLSLWLYVLFFGWPFAVVLMLALLTHELGHYAAFRAYGLPARLPAFVPFLGAFTAGAVPQDMEHDANIALAGPLTGLGLSAVCYGIGTGLNDPFWIAIANVSAFLNLFNMIPTPPFDGGRIIGAIWPPLWILGCALFVGVAIYLHVPMFFVLIIAILGLPSIIAAWRGHVDPRAALLTTAARMRISAAYLAVLFGLIVMLAIAHVDVTSLRPA